MDSEFENDINYLDQHFLTDKSIVNALIDASNLKINENVVEIGPGKGNISDTLVGEPVKEDNNKNKNKKLNIAIIISGLVLFVLLAILCFIIIIYPKINTVKEVVIPDVSNMTILEAEEELKRQGFEIEDNYEYKSSSTIEEGRVISTTPIKGATRKKGTKIILKISSGKETVTIDNYIGKAYYEVKALLEAKKIYVTIDKKSVEDKTQYKENEIIEQSIEPGSELKEGEQIILIIPDIVDTYPDFKDGTWTIDKIRDFCAEYKIKLNIKEEERLDIKEGVILDTNKTKEDRIVEGVTLTITVSKLPSVLGL